MIDKSIYSNLRKSKVLSNDSNRLEANRGNGKLLSSLGSGTFNGNFEFGSSDVLVGSLGRAESSFGGFRDGGTGLVAGGHALKKVCAFEFHWGDNIPCGIIFVSQSVQWAAVYEN